MTSLLSFDPGVRAVAWAAFADGALVRCGFLEAKTRDVNAIAVVRDYFRGRSADRTVVEKPQIYKQSRWKGDPNDCIDVALVCGAIALAVWPTDLTFVRPHDWKGNAKKEAVRGWIKKRLTVDELGQLALDVPEHLMHNVWDAVGIGLHALGRLR